MCAHGLLGEGADRGTKPAKTNLVAQPLGRSAASPQMEQLVLTLPPGELTDLDDTTAGFLRYRMEHFEHVK